MSEYFEIAYAAAAKRLVLFTGTGFTKAITQNEAPSWHDLMVSLCLELPNGNSLKRELFEADQKQAMGYEEIAQILELQFQREGLDFYAAVAKLIAKLELKGDNQVISDFLSQVKFQAITTNYDKLLQALLPDNACLSVCPGLPIPRSDAKATVYHIHGSIDVPKKMVVTSNDYFDFINTPFYFSKKLDTLLHESTVVIMGYSLGDANLKPILNSYKNIAHSQTSGGNLFFVSRGAIGKRLKEYYAHSYGIRVLDRRNIHDFFGELAAALPEATRCHNELQPQLKKALENGANFNRKYLNMENAIYEINLGITALGLSRQDRAVVNMMTKLIQTKTRLTRKKNAWEQYTHLAKWLVYLASVMEMRDSALKDEFLAAARLSLKSASKSFTLGYSYKAYQVWEEGWNDIMPGNREFIVNSLKDELKDTDAHTLFSNI